MSAPSERAKRAAEVAILFGLAGLWFASFALAMVGIQRAVLSWAARAVPPGSDPIPAEGMAAFIAIHWLWLVHMPLWIVIAAAFLALGIAVRRGSVRLVLPLRIAALAAMLETIAYVVHCATLVPVLERAIPEQAGDAYVRFAYVISRVGLLGGLWPLLPFGWIVWRLGRPAGPGPR